jgi:rSAM/selenodomain-associated transferase 1
MLKNDHDELILFFIKYPEPGSVKTRLALSIGEETAAELYKNFILDTLAKLSFSGLPFIVCYSPEEKEKDIRQWLGTINRYQSQNGEDLGERMKLAFIHVFTEGYNRAILIGSDFPDLPTLFLHEALESLENHPSVVGPAADGGYYLIGFRREAFLPTVFEGIPWGTERVLGETLSIFKNHGQNFHILPPWNDVDSLDDLKELMNRSQATGFSDSKTMAFLSVLPGMDLH